jgi:hypothetical protein
MMISEFEQWLRSRTNQEKQPFHEETVVAYAKAARALDAWMTKTKTDGNFTACDTAVLNSFFRDYNAARSRGGTNTEQHNLRHLFTWPEAEYDQPHPYTDNLNRYAPPAGPVSSVRRSMPSRMLNMAGSAAGQPCIAGQRDRRFRVTAWALQAASAAASR